MQYIVGMGASAGGLDALEKFFSYMPVRTDVSFVVVQHLSPDYKSMLGDLLSRRTRMPVVAIEDGMAIAPGVVYLNPPRMNVAIAGEKFFLQMVDSTQRVPHPIDIFFQSLSETQESRAIGIILSGTGSDGKNGIRAIKEHEGLVLVQDEDSAQFDGMPQSAIDTGMVDLVLPPEQMGEKLAAYIESCKVSSEASDVDRSGNGLENLGQIIEIVRKMMDLDLSHYKLPILRRRIERRMNLYRMQDLAAYAAFLGNNHKEVERLYHDLLIGVTSFFRDSEAFEHLAAVVIPEIMKARKKEELVRVWVTACSTGEEAYSIGILFREYMRMTDIQTEVRIFATDIDWNAIGFASEGRYHESIASHVPAAYLSRYFVREGSLYRICKEVREMIVFAAHNLIKDPPFNKTDLVCCRNMLIYLQPVLQREVIASFDYSLHCNGYLFLGPSESPGEEAHAFVPVESRWKIYRHKERGKIAKQEVGLQSSEDIVKSKTRALSALMMKKQQGNDIIEMDAKRFGFNNAGLEKTTGMKEQLYRILVEMHVGPAVIVDEKGCLLLTMGGAARYLNIPDGIPSYQLGSLLEKKAALAFMTALGKVFKEPVQIRFQYEKQQPDGSGEWIEVAVETMPEGIGSARLALVRFQTRDASPVTVQDVGPLLEEEFMDRINVLEQELQDSKGTLRETFEALEASNEEILSSNEELHSTNEELYSVNRELISLNGEYQSRITELTELNDDMENFLGNTSIGTLFLDRNFCIRKFTQAVRTVINLMDQDVGRPIGHLLHKLSGTDILKNCRFVLETLTPVKKTVTSEVGARYLMDIMPYRTRENQVKGVVVSFVDITEYI